MSTVKSLSVVDGDMFYIDHNSDCLTIIDCCLPDAKRDDIIRELSSIVSRKQIIRFISTHPDDDHVLGFSLLFSEIDIPNFYCVNNDAIKEKPTDDFEEYCKIRDSEKAFYLKRDCSRKWLNEGDSERYSCGIHILWPLLNNERFKEALEQASKGESPNNISPIIRYSIKNGASFYWMGDIESDFSENIKNDVVMQSTSILFAPHHGRESGKIPTEWLEIIQPKIVIIGEAPSKDLDYYKGYETITQNTAGDITLECFSGKVHIYVENPDYSVNFLDDEYADTFRNYIGTLNL